MATSAYEQALQQNIQQKTAIEGLYNQLIQKYATGGAFLEQGYAQLEARKERDVSKATQSLISSGLFGTEQYAGLPTAWEAEVGAGERLKLEDIASQRLSQAMLGKAGFLERVQYPYPDTGAQYAYEQGVAEGYGGGESLYERTGGWGVGEDPFGRAGQVSAYKTMSEESAAAREARFEREAKARAEWEKMDEGTSAYTPEESAEYRASLAEAKYGDVGKVEFEGAPTNMQERMAWNKWLQKQPKGGKYTYAQWRASMGS